MRDKQYSSSEKNLDNLADLMLNRINSCVEDRTKKQVKIKSAIVTKVNDDGTVNVQLPDDGGSGFSRIQNQSVYDLKTGDSVELLLKDGSFTNSWVIAKHGGGTKRASASSNSSSGSVVISGSTGSGTTSNLENRDLNSVFSSGNYYIGNGNTNVPTGCETCMLVVGGNDISAFQCIFKYSDASMLYRAYQPSGGWNAWKVITATALS